MKKPFKVDQRRHYQESSRSRIKMENNIEVLTFNDEQMQAMTRGLMAVAEEVTNAPKAANEPLRAGDFIDLLSDTDNEEDASDCEILGMMYKHTEELVPDIAQVVPFEIKVEIKKETTEVLGNVNERLGDKMDQSESREAFTLLKSLLAKKSIVISNEKISECVQNPGLKNTSFGETERQRKDAMDSVPNSLPIIENNFELGDVQAGLVSPTSNYAPIVTNIETMPAFNGQNLNNTFTTLMDLTQDNVQVKEVNLDHSQFTATTETAAEKSESEIYREQYGRNSAATFHTDQFECNYPDDTDASMDNIIELGDSSCDEDIDEETELKLINLIESDAEDQPEEGSIPSTTNILSKPDTYDVLINYVCPECGLSCGTFKKWKSHTDTEHDFRSITKLNLRTIINKEGELCYQCKDCLKKFSFKAGFISVLRHRITHMPFSDYLKCRLCDLRFKVRISLRSHLKREHFKLCKQYMCQRPTLIRHIKYHCPICNAVETTRYNWQKHLEDAHDYESTLLDTVTKINDTAFQCKECDSKFRQRQIKIHALTHARYMSFHCKICSNYKSSSILSCTWHIRRVHLNECKRSYQCQYCDKLFKSRCTRIQHLREKHAYKLLKCEVCDKEFSTSATLLSHMNSANHQKLK